VRSGAWAVAADRFAREIVRFLKVRMNRNWGWTAYRLGLFSLTPESIEGLYPNRYKDDLIRPGRNNLVPWDIDLQRQTVRLREPATPSIKLEFPAKPMLGCVGVAPAGDFAPTSGPAADHRNQVTAGHRDDR
jgi:acetamidase/formamidase